MSAAYLISEVYRYLNATRFGEPSDCLKKAELLVRLCEAQVALETASPPNPSEEQTNTTAVQNMDNYLRGVLTKKQEQP